MDNPKSHQYWNGNKNKLIRYWFYNQRGLDLFNSFRYVFMMIFGIYYTLKLTNYWWLVIMFIVFIPILSLVGYVQVHHIGRVIDWLNIKFSTHYGKYTFELMEGQLAQLKKIVNALRRNRRP